MKYYFAINRSPLRGSECYEILFRYKQIASTRLIMLWYDNSLQTDRLCEAQNAMKYYFAINRSPLRGSECYEILFRYKQIASARHKILKNLNAIIHI